MIMEKAVRQQICSKLCSILATFLPVILALAVLLLFFFPISESSPFLLTIPIALLSTIILVTLTKKKGFVEENLVQEKLQKEELKPKPSLEYFTHTEAKHEQQAEVDSDSSFASDKGSSNNGSTMGENLDLRVQKDEQQGNSQSDSSSPESDSESSTSSIMGKSCEIDHYKDQNPGRSYSLVSESDDEDDEDSLIEIDLLSSSFSGFGKEPEQKMQPKVPHHFPPESIFKHQDLIEFLAETNELNEDDNLIEIDISMDSTTKCQDLRLKQELVCLGEQ